jgi:NADPH-dependent 2,4-dienoyl-CoA reductase/sulfur reductase-like enzyme/pSer/pThr/pTyr-binding forkhead associated (FHA) protein
MAIRTKRYVIVGDGAAGMTAARVLRAADTGATITLVSDDPNPTYYRAALTNYLLGELREEQLFATTPGFYDQYRLHRLHGRAVHLDASRAALHLSQGGAPLGYDGLLLACGARARSPRFEGSHLDGVMTLRTLQDCRSVMERSFGGFVKRAVVIGGGPLALEWALGMHMRGIHVSVLLRGTHFMPGTLDPLASDLLSARLKQAGISVIIKDEVVSALGDATGRVAKVLTRTGVSLECQLVASALGVVPNTEWLGDTGIGRTQDGSVLVNERMQSSIPGVFAAGDVCSFSGVSLRLWEPAQAQARVAATNMGGAVLNYAPGAHYLATRLFDLDFASLGQVGSSPGTEEVVDFPQNTGRISYRKLWLREGRLVGVLLLGQREDKVRQGGRLFKRLIDEQLDVSEVRQHLLSPKFDLKAWLEKRRLVERGTSQPETGGVAKDAQIRRTSVLNLGDLNQAQHGVDKASAGQPGQAGAGGLLPLGSASLSPASGQQKDVRAATQALGTAVLSQFNQAPNAEVPRARTAVLGAATSERSAFVDGPNGRHALSGTLCRLGRDPNSELVVQDASAELIHAHLQKHDGAWYLRDLGSRAGTWLNEKPLDVPHRLNTGDRIAVGQVRWVFCFADEAHLARPVESRLQPSGPPAPRLVAQSGHSLGLEFALAQSPTTIGRDPGCGIWLAEGALTLQHAQLQLRNGTWTVMSQGGPVWVDAKGLAPQTEAPLAEGTVLHLGPMRMLYTQTPLSNAEHTSSSALGSAEPRRQAAPVQAFAMPASAKYQLRMHRGPEQGQIFPLLSDAVVGSHPGCAVYIPDANIAPQHLELKKQDGRLFARDLGAGTLKGGAPLGAAPVAVIASDWFQLGPSVVLVLEERP